MDEPYLCLEQALRAGCTMHAFLSGGGLRVVRVTSSGEGPSGYGEHPHVQEALRHAAEDYEAGGRPYREVYGSLEPDAPAGKYPLYLTGASKPDGDLDAWIRRGHTFDANFDGGEFVVELKGSEHLQYPPGIEERCAKGETVEWTDKRGLSFRSSPMRFCNGEAGYSTAHVGATAPANEVWFYDIVRTGRSTSLKEAFDKALQAEAVVVQQGFTTSAQASRA